MTGMHALSPIPDAVTKISCSYMDLKSLANLANASRRLSVMAHTCNSDLAKIQAVAGKCGRDLGFGVTHDFKSAAHFGIHNQKSDFKHLAWKEESVHCMQLFPDQILLQNAYSLGSCARYLFTSNSDRKNVQVRNRKGDILSTIEAKGPQQAIYFAPSQGREQVTVTESWTHKLMVWEITQINAPQKLVEHSLQDLVKDDSDFQLTEGFEFGNLLIGSVFFNKTFLKLLYTFDLSNPELPPKKLGHPKNHLFDDVKKHSDQLFGMTNDRTHMVAYQIVNGRVELLWETDVKTYGVARAYLRRVNDRWAVCEHDKRGKKDGILVLDAKTGQKRGDFTPSFDAYLYNCEIWGNDILVADLRTGNKVAMCQLPLGEPLFVLEQEQCKHLLNKSANKQELTLVYQQKESELVRGVSWSAPLAETSIASLPATDPSFLENIYSCFAKLLSHFTDFWRWLFTF